MAVWCKITPLRTNFYNSSIKVQYRTTIDVFARISCRSVPLQRKATSMYPLQKTPTLFTAILHPFVAKILIREICVRPTYACKILSGSVKVCGSYSRKADYEQIHITLSYICMTAYKTAECQLCYRLQRLTTRCEHSAQNEFIHTG